MGCAAVCVSRARQCCSADGPTSPLITSHRLASIGLAQPRPSTQPVYNLLAKMRAGCHQALLRFTLLASPSGNPSPYLALPPTSPQHPLRLALPCHATSLRFAIHLTSPRLALPRLAVVSVSTDLASVAYTAWWRTGLDWTGLGWAGLT